MRVKGTVKGKQHRCIFTLEDVFSCLFVWFRSLKAKFSLPVFKELKELKKTAMSMVHCLHFIETRKQTLRVPLKGSKRFQYQDHSQLATPTSTTRQGKQRS